MLVTERIRIQLPGWLMSYRTLRLKQQKCLDRIRHLSAALRRSRNNVTIVRNLVEYRRWLDFLKSLEQDAPKMRFTDERQWQYGGDRNYYVKTKDSEAKLKERQTVKLPKLKLRVASNKSTATRANSNFEQSTQLVAVHSSIDEETLEVVSKCPTDRSTQSDRSGSSMLQDLRLSLERQETIPSKGSPRGVTKLPHIIISTPRLN